MEDTMNTFSLRNAGLALVLAVALGLSGQAAAADASGPDSLSPEKQAIVKKLHEDFFKNTKETRQALIAKKHELGALMHAQTPDESKIQAVAAEVSALRAKIYSTRVALKTKLIQAGVPDGHGKGCGYGPGKRGGHSPGKGRDCCSRDAQ